MTVSPESHSETEGRYSNVTEGDVAQRPEQESSMSQALKILLVVGLITLGAIGIYVVVVLFSAGVQGPVQEEGSQQPLQAPAEE